MTHLYHKLFLLIENGYQSQVIIILYA